MKCTSRQIFDLTSFSNEPKIFICSSGYESRARNVFEHVKQLNFLSKVCFAFKDNINEIRRTNDEYFVKNGFEMVSVDGNESKEIRRILERLNLEKANSEGGVEIFVDYSCMTRVFYAEIINYLKGLQVSSITLYFLYSEAHFTSPKNGNAYNQYVEPIFGFSNLSVPERPTALIIGLGYERRRAYSLKEYLDAREVYLFVAQNDTDPRFEEEVLKQNRDLIRQVPASNILHYPLKDMKYTELLLFNLCESLLEGYRIVLAPCGPKPFTLLSFIVSCKLGDIDVWRVSAGGGNVASDIEASGKIITFCLEIKNIVPQ